MPKFDDDNMAEVVRQAQAIVAKRLPDIAEDRGMSLTMFRDATGTDVVGVLIAPARILSAIEAVLREEFGKPKTTVTDVITGGPKCSDDARYS